jgi:hypothetical protein
MNALDEKLRRGVQGSTSGVRLAVTFGLLAAGGAMGGCAEIHRAASLPPVNPESPVAGAVAAAAMQSFPPPSFQSVPPKPLNIPPPDAVKTAVIDMVRCRRAYADWAAAHPAEVSGTTAFSERLRARLDNNPDDRPTPQAAAASEADAAKLRAYAEPPPPISPGPPLDASQASPASVAAPTHTTHAAAPTTVAVAAPPPAAPNSTAALAPPPQPLAVAVVQPSMTPHYRDPLLARCR